MAQHEISMEVNIFQVWLLLPLITWGNMAMNAMLHQASSGSDLRVTPRLKKKQQNNTVVSFKLTHAIQGIQPKSFRKTKGKKRTKITSRVSTEDSF